MENNIQKARDVLAKWRNNRFSSPWEVDKNLPFSADLVGLFAPAQKEYAVKFDDDQQPDGAVADLIVGTAGNPELLDAIDGMFATYLAAHSIGPTYRRDTERIANAILAVDTAQEDRDE